MGEHISLDIDNFINNDPALLIIFFSLSLFGSLLKFVFTENSKRKNNIAGWLLITRMILLALTSSLIIFSGFDLIRKYLKGNLIYLVVFFLGFASDILIKHLVRIKNVNGLIKFIDDLYNFIKSRRQ